MYISTKFNQIFKVITYSLIFSFCFSIFLVLIIDNKNFFIIKTSNDCRFGFNMKNYKSFSGRQNYRDIIYDDLIIYLKRKNINISKIRDNYVIFKDISNIDECQKNVDSFNSDIKNYILDSLLVLKNIQKENEYEFLNYDISNLIFLLNTHDRRITADPYIWTIKIINKKLILIILILSFVSTGYFVYKKKLIKFSKLK